LLARAPPGDNAGRGAPPIQAAGPPAPAAARTRDQGRRTARSGQRRREAEPTGHAAPAGLTRARELGLGHLTARSDSRLLIAHVNGESHIRNARLLELESQITDCRMQIGTVLFEWIPATAKGEAHRLVAGALQSATG
jgi:phage tail tape-measure protein